MRHPRTPFLAQDARTLPDLPPAPPPRSGEGATPWTSRTCLPGLGSGGTLPGYPRSEDPRAGHVGGIGSWQQSRLEGMMAERTVLVCDVCGALEAEIVTMKTGSRTALKDLCRKHMAEMFDGSRKPRRGRRPGSGRSSGTQANPSGRSRRATAIKPRSERRVGTVKESPSRGPGYSHA